MSKIPIRYPTWKVRGSPTPNEALFVCDMCGNASWVPGGLSVVWCWCTSPKTGNFRRMRRATKVEKEEGIRALKKII